MGPIPAIIGGAATGLSKLGGLVGIGKGARDVLGTVGGVAGGAGEAIGAAQDRAAQQKYMQELLGLQKEGLAMAERSYAERAPLREKAFARLGAAMDRGGKGIFQTSQERGLEAGHTGPGTGNVPALPTAGSARPNIRTSRPAVRGEWQGVSPSARTGGSGGGFFGGIRGVMDRLKDIQRPTGGGGLIGLAKHVAGGGPAAGVSKLAGIRGGVQTPAVSLAAQRRRRLMNRSTPIEPSMPRGEEGF